MVDVIQGIGIIALAFAVGCQVMINRSLMREIDLLHRCISPRHSAHIDGGAVDG